LQLSARIGKAMIWLMQFARVSLGDRVAVETFQPPKQQFDATLLVAEVGRWPKRINTPLELEASDLVAHITTRLAYMVRV
jgi:hypothetical protein